MAQGYAISYTVTPKDLVVKAGEDISAYSAVRILTTQDASSGIGQAYKTLTRNNTWPLGIALADALSGNWVTVRIFGIVVGFNNLVPGEIYCADGANPGGITRTTEAFPYTTDQIIVNYENNVIGLAITQNSLFVNYWNNSPILNTKGYNHSGYDGANYTTYGSQIKYATDTSFLMMYPFTGYAHYAGAGISNIGVKGYACNGYNNAVVSTCEFILYATDSWGSAITTVGCYPGGGISEGRTKGYLCGGYSNAYFTTNFIITYAVDTSTAYGSISAGRYVATGLSEGKSKGYLCGGYTGNSVKTTDKLSFATDTAAAATSADLTVLNQSPASITDSAIKGFILGGYTTAAILLANKLIFSTDVTTAQTTANLSVARYGVTGISEGTKGYSCGGYVLPYTDKTVMATEITTPQGSASVSIIGQGQAYGCGFGEGIA